MNDWSTLNQSQMAQFRASNDELAAATVLREKGNAKAMKEQLFRCILSKDATGVRQILSSSRGLIERHSPEGLTPLTLACGVGNEEVVSVLLDLGADVFARDSIGATPLIHASLRGHVGICSKLLETKAGGQAGREMMLRQATRQGETAVHAASKGGDAEILKILSDAGAETGLTCTVNEVFNVDALMIAASHNQPATVTWLLARGITPSRRDDAGRDALMHACLKGAKEAAQLLLSPSVQPPLDIGSKDLKGFDYFAQACIGGNLELVELLLQRDPSSQKLLKSDQQTVSVTDESRGASILSAVAERGHANILDWLLKNKIAGANQIIIGGPDSPMFKAVKSEKAAAVDVLLEHGGRIDCRDQKGRTPLHWCAAHNKRSMASLLVARGASLVAVDNEGRVPRQLAYKHHHHDLSTMLSSMAHNRYYDHCQCYKCVPGGQGPEIHDQVPEDNDSAILSVTRHQKLLHGDAGEEAKRKNMGFSPGVDVGASHDKNKRWPKSNHSPPPGPPGAGSGNANYLSSFYTQGHKVWGEGGAGTEGGAATAAVQPSEARGQQRADQYYTWPYGQGDGGGERERCCLASGGRNNFRNKNAPIVWLPTHRD